MKNLSVTFVLSIIILVTTSCSERKNLSPLPSISDEAKQDLKQPVNCATAEHDISVLESERSSIAKQMLSGVRSVLPIAVVAGVLMGDYRDRVKVATGKYNRDIEVKIEEIKATCGLR